MKNKQHKLAETGFTLIRNILMQSNSLDKNKTGKSFDLTQTAFDIAQALHNFPCDDSFKNLTSKSHLEECLNRNSKLLNHEYRYEINLILSLHKELLDSFSAKELDIDLVIETLQKEVVDLSFITAENSGSLNGDKINLKLEAKSKAKKLKNYIEFLQQY